MLIKLEVSMTRFFKRRKSSSPIGYALGLFGVSLITQLFHGFNLSYWTDTGMVTIYWASACKIIFIIVDWLDDIIVGALSEHTKSRLGKRIPWLIFGCIWVPVFIILTYAVNINTDFSAFQFIAYYIIISILVENANTVYYINYNALFPTLFSTTNSRNKTATYKHIFEILAFILCYLFTPILLDEIGISYALIGAIYGTIFVVCVIIMLRSIRISDDLKNESKEPVKYSTKKMIKETVKNRPFILYHVAQSFFIAIMAIVVSLYPMYCKYVLHISGWRQSVVLICLFATLLFSIPIWSKVIKKIGFTKVWMISFIMLPMGLFLLYFPNNFISGCVVTALIGPSFGGLLLTPDMILAELIDIDKIKYRVSREAALGSVGSFISRISVIIAAIITSLLSFAFGYESGINPGPNPSLTFQVTFGIMLGILGLMGTICAIIYVKVSKKDRMSLSKLKRLECEETTEIDINTIIDETR